MKKAHEQQQTLTTLVRSRWFKIVAGLMVLFFLLGFTPGGEAMWTLDVWMLGWIVTFLVLSRVRIQGFIKAVLIGLVIFLALSILML